MVKMYQRPYRIISFVLIIFCPFNVLSKNETISLSSDDIRVALKDKTISELPQCTLTELQKISRKYEVCHRQNIQQIEQQFIKRVPNR